MPKTILYIAISLDGYVAGRNDETDWMDPYGEVEYGYRDFLSTVGAIVMGRRSYEVGVERGWFGQYNYGSPIVVVSKSRPAGTPAGADFTFVSEGVEAAHALARQMAGDRNVYVFGGAQLAMRYLQAGLVDELVIGVIPVLLGDGKLLFDRLGKRLALKLVDNRTLDKGLVMLHYSISHGE